MLRVLVLTILFRSLWALVHHENVKIVARDGTILNTDVYRPWHPLEKPPPVPTVVFRTPYGISNLHEKCHAIVENKGWAVLAQDFRGTHGSSGTFHFWNESAPDAADTLIWLSKQAWYDGVVFTEGTSALAVTQYLDVQMTGGLPLNLSGQCMNLGSADLHQFAMQDGAYREGDISHWLVSVLGAQGGVIAKDELLDNEGWTSFWNPMSLQVKWVENIHWPVVHIGAWYDIFNFGTLETYQMYRLYEQLLYHGPGPQYLIMSAGGHCLNRSSIKFPNSSWVVTGNRELCDDFIFDRVVKREPLAPSTAFLYVMGPDSVPYGSKSGNYWIESPVWPPVGKRIQLYLGPDGQLGDFEVAKEGTVSYSFDPSKPAPTIGGNNLLGSCGAQDLRPNEKREDNIVWTTLPFVNRTVLIGSVSCNIFVSSNRNDTDYIARLSDVYPDGRSIFLVEGLVRMRWRGRGTVPEYTKPGQMVHLSVAMWNTGYVVNPGHALRFTITSSSYPRYSVNRNNGQLVREGGPFLVAENNVHFGGSFPSYVSLSVIPEETVAAMKI